MPPIEKGTTSNQVKKTIKEEREEFRKKLEIKYGKPFAEIKTKNLTQNTNGDNEIEFIKRSRRIRKADKLRPIAQDILTKIPEGSDHDELELAILAIEDEPTDEQIDELIQIIDRLKSKQSLQGSKVNVAKLIVNPVEHPSELIKRGTALVERLREKFKKQPPAINIANKLNTLETSIGLVNIDNTHRTQKNVDKLATNIAELEKEVPVEEDVAAPVGSADAAAVAILAPTMPSLTASNDFSQNNPLLASKKQPLQSQTSSRTAFGAKQSRGGPGIARVERLTPRGKLQVGKP